MAGPVQIAYFLDPCFAASWALLPALAPVLQALGPEVSLRVRTLPLTDGTDEAARAAVSGCWPLGPAAWSEGPKACSLPVSRAAKAAQALGGVEAEARFLLALSPILLQTPARPYGMEQFLQAVVVAGLDPIAFARRLDDPALDRAIEADLAAGREAGLRCLPAALVTGPGPGRVLIEGTHDVALYRQALVAQRDALAGAALVATPLLPELAQLMPDEAPTG